MAKEQRAGGIARLLAFAGARRALVYVGCGLSAISMLVSFIPFICIWLAARDLIAVAPQWSRAEGIAAYGWAAVGASAASIALYFAALMCTHLAAFRCASTMRKATTAHLMRVPLGYFSMHATGELRRRIDGCAAATETLIAHNLPDSVGSVAMVAGMLALLAVFDWRLGLACAVAIAVSFACLTKMMSGEGMAFMRRYQASLTRMNKAGTEYVRGIPVVKVFQQTVHSFKAFHDAIADYAHLAEDYAVHFCQGPQTLQLTALNGLVVFLVPAAILLAPGETDLVRFATNFAFYAVFSALVPTAMTKLMFMGEGVQVATDALENASAVLDAPELPASAEPQPACGAEVRFEDVGFTYEGATTPALEHVSIAVPAGSTVAFVGPSGGGKSTCASLVPRFWDVDTGAVRVGGADVRQMDAHDLMGQVAFVFQANRLFAQSLADNVRAARPDASDEDVRRALAAAQCDDIVAKLPQGLDTLLGPGGAYLSGGEVQRVALARAILKDAPVVVLDEATAFADPENEALIQRAFAHLCAGRTTIMIAHRLSTVVSADLIVVFDAGHVVEQGTHGELLAAGGLYARMWADYERAARWKIARAPRAEEPVPADDAGAAATRAGGAVPSDDADGPRGTAASAGAATATPMKGGEA